MSAPNHSLLNEFPEMNERIHQLKASNHHFRRLLEEHDEVDREVRRIENAGMNVTDETLEDLRKKRLKLKDELFGLLKSAAA